jgi:uncharacterized membrane protein YccC
VIPVRAVLVRTRAGAVTALRAHGLAAIKASVAAVLAWLLVGWLMPSSVGFYAPLVAVLSVLPTLVRTLRDVVQRLVAVGLGLGLGWIAAVTVGLHSWSLGALLVLAFLFSTWRRLGEEGIQAPVGALFILLLAEDPTVYAAQLLAEGVLGSLIAAAVNVLVLPPLQVRPADRALADLRHALGDLVDDMSSGVGDGWPPEQPGWLRRARDMDGRITAARTAVREGQESTALNPRGRRWRKLPTEQRESLLRLEQISVVVRALADTLEEAADPARPGMTVDDGFRSTLARALRHLAEALTSYGTPENNVDVAAEEQPLELAVGDVDELQRWLAEEQAGGVASLVAEGAVVTQLARAVRILRNAPLQ